MQYEKGDCGVEVMNIKNAVQDEEDNELYHLTGTTYGSSKQCNNIDCLQHTWNSQNKQATIKSWSVLTYFNGLNRNRKLPQVVKGTVMKLVMDMGNTIFWDAEKDKSDNIPEK